MSNTVQPCAHTAYADDIDWTPAMSGFLFMLDTKYNVSNTDVARLFSQYFPGIAETCIGPVCPSFEAYLQKHLARIRGNRTSDALRRHLEIQAGFDSHKMGQAPAWWTMIQNQIVFVAQRLGIQLTATPNHQPSRLAALLARNPVPPIGTGATTQAPATTATNVTVDGISIANPAQAPAPVPPQAISMAVSRHEPNAVNYQLQSPAPTASMRDAQRVAAEKGRTAAQRAAAKAAEAAAREARMQPAGGNVRSRQAPAAAGAPSPKTYAGAPRAQTPPDASARETRAHARSKRELLTSPPAPLAESQSDTSPLPTRRQASSSIRDSLSPPPVMAPNSGQATDQTVAPTRLRGPSNVISEEAGSKPTSLRIDANSAAYYVNEQGLQVSEFVKVAERVEQRSVFLVEFINGALAVMPFQAKMQDLVEGRTALYHPTPLQKSGTEENEIDAVHLSKFAHHKANGIWILTQDNELVETAAPFPAAEIPNPKHPAIQNFGPLMTSDEADGLDATEQIAQYMGNFRWQAALVPPEMRWKDWLKKKELVVAEATATERAGNKE